jgi:hypothetical protein
MDTNGFEVLILLLKMMNKQLSIEVADDFGMHLVDMAKAYQVRCTKPLTFRNSSHVRPFLSLTNSPEQDEILRIASSKIQTWVNGEISSDERQRIIDGCQFGSETKDIDKRELRRKVLSIIRELKEIPLDDMNQYLEMAKELVKRELGELLSRSNEKTHNVIVVRSSSPLTVETARRLQFDITDTEDNDEDYDDEHYDDEEEEDVDEELSSKDLGLLIDINLPMQQLARTIAALERIDMDTKRPLCILGGKCETRRQVSGVYLELIYDLINGHVMHLCTDQTTRISNGLPKLAIVMALCYFRGIHLAIASQIDIPPMSIAVADQKRVNHMEENLNQFRATYTENSNEDSKLFQSFLLEAWNEHCQSSTPSQLQQSLIDLDEKARQNRAGPFFSRVNELEAYKAKHGHLNVQCEEDKSLYDFCCNIRRARRDITSGKGTKSKLTDDRIAALDAIGFDWQLNKNRAGPFFSRVNELEAYKKKHGHLNVRSKEDLSLYNFCWEVRNARRDIASGKGTRIKLTGDRIAALDAIGFDWQHNKTQQMICEVNMFDCDLTFIIPHQYIFTNNQLSLKPRGMN